MSSRRVKTYEPDEKTLRTFFENILERDWLHLVAIEPDTRKIAGRCHSEPEDAIDWVFNYQAKRWNMYYQLNAPSNTMHKKAERAHIRTLYGYQIDWDLPDGMNRASAMADRLIEEARERICGCDLLPGNPNIIMSGNGIQGVWLLADPQRASADKQAALEVINQRLLAYFGTNGKGGTWNSDRVLRVPGSWNFPDAKKRERGCVPIMAELLDVASQDFAPSDFDRLPAVVAQEAKAGPDTRSRIDYTQYDYRRWEAFCWQDVLDDAPDLPYRVQETLDDPMALGDRSRALWTLICGLTDFIMLATGIAAVDMVDDTDIYKQISELCIEAEEADVACAEAMGHIHAHQYGLRQLGYEVGRHIAAAAAQRQEPDNRKLARAERKAEYHELETGPEDDVSPLDAAKLFMSWLVACTPKGMLPNKMEGKDAPAIRQPCTLSNVREVLHNAGVEARWDAMKDKPRFFVTAADTERQRPAFNWERALSRAAPSKRSAAEIELLCDGMADVGMSARRELEGFLSDIASEDPFHPLEDYCKATPWDGKDRLGGVLDCLKTTHPLARRYLQIFFRSCIAAIPSLRNFKRTGQGLQISSTVVLIGPQGIGKSTFWEKLAPPGFLSTGRSLQMGGHKEADSMRACLSGLICALSEIGQSLRRSEADALKDFQSAPTDDFRVSFNRRETLKPRMTTFVGTANPDFMLQDQTGNRRYLTMLIDSIDWAQLDKVSEPAFLQQLYAQAYHEVIEDDESWWLDKSEERIRDEANEHYRELPEEEERLNSYVGNLTGHEVDRWLNSTQICEVIGIRKASARGFATLRRLLLERGFEYHDTVRQKKGSDLRKVYLFRILPERYDELKLVKSR